MTRFMQAMRLAAIVLAACGGAAAPAPMTTTPQDGHRGHHGDHDGHHGHQGDQGDHGAAHRFDDAAQWATVFDAPDRDAWQRPDAVVGLLDLAPGQVVVDIGAGTGYFLGRLAHGVGATGQVIGTDVEPAMVQHMTERAAREGWRNVVARLTPPEDPQLAAASVDRVLVVDVWHHLPDPAAYAARLAAALRPGGVIAVVDFTLEAPMAPPAEARVAAATVAATLRAAGLTAEIAAEDLPHQYVVLGRRR